MIKLNHGRETVKEPVSLTPKSSELRDASTPSLNGFSDYKEFNT